MAAQPIKTISGKVISRSFAKIPAVILEEYGLVRGSNISIMYGKNCTLMIVIPSSAKLNNTMQERISILVNERLD